MVETTPITTPIKIYGANHITRRCAFTGEVQNQAALYDNSAQTQASFYNADTSQRISWQAAFKDKCIPRDKPIIKESYTALLCRSVT